MARLAEPWPELVPEPTTARVHPDWWRYLPQRKIDEAAYALEGFLAHNTDYDPDTYKRGADPFVDHVLEMADRLWAFPGALPSSDRSRNGAGEGQ
jgi:hypothetical protein